MRAIKSITRNLIAIIVTAMVSAACTDKNQIWTPFKQSASLTSSAVIGYNQTEATIITSGDDKITWTANVTEGAEWCSFSESAKQPSATGHATEQITVYLTENDSNERREFKIGILFHDRDKTFVEIAFSQLGKTYDASYEHLWGEQPAKADQDNPNYIYKTYYTILSGGTGYVRNYSVCFDTDTKVSRWVAYPVHTVYTNSRNYETYPETTNGRTNAWAFDDAVTEYFGNTDNYNTAYKFVSTYDKALDAYNTYTQPIIPQKYQQNIASIQASGSPYSNGGAYGDQQTVKYLNRGHMLPSASRYSSWTTNAQTFYATNMMPQNNYFNQYSWGTLEGDVRNSKCNDTLFVVVGTLYEPGTRITSRGRELTVPSHCYKLLLRTKNGNTRKFIGDIKNADELICIGFVYANADESRNTTPAQAAVPVAEIEKRAGFKFFRNLDPSIADKVKSQCNIDDWPAMK